MRSLKESGKSLLHDWASIVQRLRIWIILVVLTFSGSALVYTINNLGMNTDTEDMLSPDLRWRQLDQEYERNFPQTSNNLLVVIEAPTPDQAQDAAQLIYERLRQETGLFRTVYYPAGLPLFKDSSLLYLDIDELQDLSDNLAVIQPFLARLTGDQTLRGLFSMLSDALEAIEDGEDIDIKPLVDQINLALVAAQHDRPYQVSWQRLMQGTDEAASVNREFIILQPVLDYSGLFPGQAAIDRLQALERELQQTEAAGVHIRLTGSVALAHEELLSVTRGMEVAFVLALVMVTIVMIFGLGSVWLVCATLITLFIGLVLTAAFAAFAVGDLNLISIAFAVLYIGLGVDYATHYCLRYRELRMEGVENLAAIRSTSVSVGSSLFLCAITTSVGFFAFIPTNYRGVAELGLISGTGMFISLLITLTLLPALLFVRPFRPVTREKKNARLVRRFLTFPIRNARTVRAASAVLFLVLAWFATRVHFDPNTLNLQDPDNPSVQTYKDLLADSDTSPLTGILLVRGKAAAQAIRARLEHLPVVERVVWQDDFVPTDQDEKLLLVEEMNLLLGSLEPGSPPPITDADRLKSLTDISDQLNAMQPGGRPAWLGEFRDNLRDYMEYLSIFQPDDRSAELRILERSLLQSLPGRLDLLRRSLNAQAVTAADLPPELTERWHNGEDVYLLEIYPRENIDDVSALRRFVRQLQAAEPDVTGSPVVTIEAGDAVVGAFQQAFLYALAVIVILLLLLLDRKWDTVYIIATLAMAAIGTAGTSALLDIPLNFANIIALPLLLGIGVDSGIHILHRYRTAMPSDNNLLATSSARAVLVSALTTIISVGNLAFSSHQGTASMGLILTLGIIITTLCMLIMLPSLLAAHIRGTGTD